MHELWEQDKRRTDPKQRSYRSDPSGAWTGHKKVRPTRAYSHMHENTHLALMAGTLAFLGRVQELVTLMRDCRHILKYHTPEDSRLTTARAIVGEFRVCTQYAIDAWETKDDWLKTPAVKKAKQLFVAPETLHALHCTVEAFTGTDRAAHHGRDSMGSQTRRQPTVLLCPCSH